MGDAGQRITGTGPNVAVEQLNPAEGQFVDSHRREALAWWEGRGGIETPEDLLTSSVKLVN